MAAFQTGTKRSSSSVLWGNPHPILPFCTTSPAPTRRSSWCWWAPRLTPSTRPGTKPQGAPTSSRPARRGSSRAPELSPDLSPDLPSVPHRRACSACRPAAGHLARRGLEPRAHGSGPESRRPFLPLRRPRGRRSLNAWAALVITDLIPVATFAPLLHRAPGRLAAGGTLMIVHLAGLASTRRLLGRGRTWRLLGAVAAVCLPIAMVLGTTLFFAGTGRDPCPGSPNRLGRPAAPRSPRCRSCPAWCSRQQWAAAAARLLAEMISSGRRVPAVFALTPAVGDLPLHLRLRDRKLASPRPRARWQRRAAGTSPPSSVRTRAGRTDSWPAPDNTRGHASRTVSLRAAAVGAVHGRASCCRGGPHRAEPARGTRRHALVAWHGRGGGAGVRDQRPVPAPGRRRGSGSTRSSRCVRREEVDNPTTTLFTVHSTVATREADQSRLTGTRQRLGNTGAGVRAGFANLSPPRSKPMKPGPRLRSRQGRGAGSSSRSSMAGPRRQRHSHLGRRKRNGHGRVSRSSQEVGSWPRLTAAEVCLRRRLDRGRSVVRPAGGLGVERVRPTLPMPNCPDGSRAGSSELAHRLTSRAKTPSAAGPGGVPDLAEVPL